MGLAAPLLPLVLAAVALAAPALGGPRQMLPAAEQAEWLAVGRLNVSGQGYCTATLIAPDLVMTAAHCVVDRRTGVAVRPERVHFLAGFRAGAFAAHGQAAGVTLVPGFDRAARDIGRDLALVRLAEPMEAGIRPIPVAPALDPALPLFVASYGIDRSQILSTERDCRFRTRNGGVIFTTCEGVPGVSGAPVLQRVDGSLTAVAVASAVINPRKVPIASGAVLAVEATRDRVDLLGALAAAEEPGAVFTMASPPP